MCARARVCLGTCSASLMVEPGNGKTAVVFEAWVPRYTRQDSSFLPPGGSPGPEAAAGGGCF